MLLHLTGVKEMNRTLIREKLASGGLAHNGIHGFSGGPGKGQICVACGTTVGESQFVREGIGSGEYRKALQFHTACFSIWDSERKVLGGVKPVVNGHTKVTGT
jgi:hypothetical protein